MSRDLPESLARYHRQILLPGIGIEGQERLASAHVLVVGCGALGSMLADGLARAGIGTLSIVDRDVVELTNLQRQVLFDEEDVRRGTPKAAAARAKIAAINAGVSVHAYVEDFDARSAERLAEGVDLLADGLDNFETRYLVNDLAVARGLPYVYGGAVGTTGMSMPILPSAARRRPDTLASLVSWPEESATPCLRCLFPEPPPPGTTPTCDTAGVLGAAVSLVTAHQLAQIIKLLTGNLAALDRRLVSFDLWRNDRHEIDTTAARRPQCVCCGEGTFAYLEGPATRSTTSLCGRNAIQISAPDGENGLDLAMVARRLAPFGDFRVNEYLLRGIFSGESADAGPIELTLFTDGRAIVKGTTEPARARSIYAKYVGG